MLLCGYVVIQLLFNTVLMLYGHDEDAVMMLNGYTVMVMIQL